MSSLKLKCFIAFIIVGLLIMDCEGRKKKKTGMTRAQKKRLEKMEILRAKETNPVNFSRLVIMRLIYGIASWMGVEERVSGILNGAFVPPGAEDDDYGFGGFDDDDGDGFDFGDFFDGE